MRSEAEGLHLCPVCRRQVTRGELGLRDFDWLKGALPAKVGLSDLDGFLEQSATGRGLFMEFKPPGGYLPLGQRILLTRLVKAGFDVWVIWELDNEDTDWHVKAGAMTDTGQVPFVDNLTIGELRERVAQWWADGFTRR